MIHTKPGPLTPKGGMGQPKGQCRESTEGSTQGQTGSQKDKRGRYHEPEAPLGGLGAENSQGEFFPENSSLTLQGGMGQPKGLNLESADGDAPGQSESQKAKGGKYHGPEAPTSAGSVRAGGVGATTSRAGRNRSFVDSRFKYLD